MNTFALWLLIALAILNLRAIHKLKHQQRRNMATLKERFDAVDSRLGEASSELTAELQKLRDALASASVTLSPEAEASLANIEAKAAALADIVPNAETPAV